MSTSDSHARTSLRLTVSAAALALGAASALAQTTPPPAGTSPAGATAPVGTAGGAGGVSSDGVNGTQQPGSLPGGDEEIVVTGFRASLNSALNLKRTETAAVDSIVAEDIGKFPDSNLAESMQRIPGVSLSRGDGGEGRNISVRGLGAQFTRVRINGMEGAAQTGSSDIYGAGNSGRSFDFNVFPSEIFSSLAVRKTPSADVEEGSLGATVDLKAPHPLDYHTDFVFTATGRGVYNQLSKRVDPRASALLSKQFLDGTLGILASGAYQRRHIREVGYSAVDILALNANGGLCSPIGFTPQNPANSALKGTDALNCSTNNPRTSTTTAYNTAYNARGALNVPFGGAFLPRLPRYVNSEQDQQRIAGTLTVQFKPDDRTDISIDALYSRFKVERRDNYIAGISFGRTISNNGQPMTSVKDLQLTSGGSIAYGLFDGVDVRSEGLRDRFTTTFLQGNFNFRHQFTDNLELTGLVGVSRSVYDGKSRIQTFMDAIDTKNFSIDFRDGKSTPLLGFGFDVANPANYSYAAGLADGTVLGGFSTQGKPQKNTTVERTFEGNANWTVTPDISLKAGAQYRENEFTAYSSNVSQQQLQIASQRLGAILPLSAGTTLASITRQITNLDSLFGRNAPASWAAIDTDKWIAATGYNNLTYCRTECGASRSEITEEVASAYLMATFNTHDSLPLPVRGDIGVRYVHTTQNSIGYIPVTAPTGYAYLNIGQRTEYDRSYADWLPSANVVVDLTPKLLARFSAAKVLSRAELGQLPPNASVTATTQTASINNPAIDPIRANTFDAALEWYFQPGSLLSVAYFYKDIKTYIQRITSRIPFSDLGLPNGLLSGSPSVPSDIFTVSQFQNTPGGKLQGFEVNAQVQLRFLPGFLKNLGVLANYTRVTSKINYILTSANGVPITTTSADLIGLSKNAASGTLYYEDKRFSIRGTASYRGSYIRGIPASTGSDLQGNKPNTFVDASASYNLTDNVKLILEVQNITDARNTLTIDSQRQDTLFETRIGRTFNVGASFKF